MAKRRRKKSSSLLTWTALSGTFRLIFQSLFKAGPLLLLSLLGLGIFWAIREELYADPGFTINHVEVLPAGPLSEERIQELERNFLGHNLFKISLDETAKRLERDATIREARVSRVFPATLRIEILSRTPFAQIQFHPRGPYYVAGEDGVILEASWAKEPGLLFVDAGESGFTKTQAGDKFPIPGYAEGITLVRAFWKHPLGRSETLQALRLNRLGEAALVLKEGPELRFGRNPMRKFASLDAAVPLLKGPDRDRMVYIELQYQDLIVKKK